MDLGIRGKTALVTAASKGIGKAVAEMLASEGCRVAICSRSKSNLESTANEIRRRYDTEVTWCVCDLNKARDIENTYNIVKKEFGSIDILVNNCGGPVAGGFREVKDDDWQDAFEQILLSTVKFSNLIVPDMILREWGRIINITSVSVKQPIDSLVLSNSFRSGVVAFAKTLSNEIAGYNITVNNIAPGYTLTSRLYDLAVHRAKTSSLSHEEVLSEMVKNVPLARLARPEEIAALAVFLASYQASYITGTTIPVDGGIIKGY
jgi:3-oxoacyl-[acyl-carrier protein] reductase